HNFIVDPRVKGNVTVISSAPTDIEGLYDIFLSILKVHGFAAVPSGDVIKIVPDALAKQEGQTPVPGRTVRLNDALVTAVIPVRNVNAAELVAILRPLLPQEAHLAGFISSNTLVVADTAANVKRMMNLVAELDVASDEAVELVALEHADAEDIVRVLSAVTDPSVAQGGAPSGMTPFVAYARTNTVLVKASPAAMPRIRALIRSLDVPDRGPDQIEVVALKFASAVDLVPVLQSVLGGGPVGGGAGGTGGAANQARARVRSGPGEPSIQADESTNMLIMQAPTQDLRRMMAVIEQLDVRRAQVLVEGIIAELSTERADELGVQWQTAQNATGWAGGTQLPGSESGAIGGAAGESGGINLGQGLSFGYLRGLGDIRVLLRALNNDRYTNVLSTPTLMTLDNAEAEIVVGQNVPFVTGQFTNQATTPDNPFQTITRQDVGVMLKVKPQINFGDTVTLELEQEVSSVDTATTGADLITNKRSIKTTVLVDDQDIVVLGGLIENDLRENAQKVPLLGDIPLLGQLFRNTRSDARKTNLMVFLRPSIMRDPEASRELARVRYGALREKQEAAEGSRRTLIRQPAPRLPAFDGLLE
ncbi:MAG: type II secretion system secretin GspD, partial [Gammaproteobacteria bacterium]